MLRTVYWYLHFVISLLLQTPHMLQAKKHRLAMTDAEFTAFVTPIVQKWARAQAKASGARFHITGQENIPKDGAVLFVCNHQSNFDIDIMLSFIDKPMGFLAKVEILKLPLVRTWMNFIRCVFLDRSDIRKGAQAIVDGIQVLKSGHSLVLFPEGTRSKGPKPLGEFKGGSFKLATKSLVPVVPITVDGSYKIMEANHNRIVPADVYITIHEPLDTAAMSKEELARLPETVKEIIAKALPYA